MSAVNIENLKALKYHIFYKCGRKYGNIFKEEHSIEMLKIVGLIKNIELYQDYDWRKHKPRI